MENNTQARKWTLVINNPLEAGLDHAAIREILHRFAPSYFCMADEIATTGTYHTHIFLLAPSLYAFPPSKTASPRRILRKHTGAQRQTAPTFSKRGIGPIPTRRKLRFPAPLRNGETSPPKRRKRPRKCSSSFKTSGPESPLWKSSRIIPNSLSVFGRLKPSVKPFWRKSTVPRIGRWK